MVLGLKDDCHYIACIMKTASGYLVGTAKLKTIESIRPAVHES
jgi:hypothetical protein